MSYKRLLTDHWANGFAWLFWNAMGMFGLWAAGLVIFLFLENPPWLKLIDRGQFFLYSVGFLGQAMYILTKELKITTIPHRRLLVSATVSCLIICTLLFGGNVLSNFSDSSDITTRTALLRYIGLSVLLSSITIGFLVTIAAEERGNADFSDLGKTGVRRLNDQITEVPGG